MPDFDYSNPVKFHFGLGRHKQVGDIARHYGRKALLVASEALLNK
ncbi:hypothetical protein [Candidatus Symbiopectobacterium sp.]|nr:hypothetical protein [Candidatus Symbiopectobacterium sp.]